MRQTKGDNMSLTQQLRAASERTIDKLLHKIGQRMTDATYKRQGYTKITYPNGDTAYERVNYEERPR